MAPSTIFRTAPASVDDDWYYHLHQVIPVFRELAKPPSSNLTTEPTFSSCRLSRLLRDLSGIHTAIILHSNRDPDFLSDDLVRSFLAAVIPMASCLNEDILEAWMEIWFDRVAYANEEEDPPFNWLDVFPYQKGRSLLEQDNPFLLPTSEPLLSETSTSLVSRGPVQKSAPISVPSKPVVVKKEKPVVKAVVKGPSKPKEAPPPKKTRTAPARAVSPVPSVSSSKRVVLSEAASDLGTRQLRSSARHPKTAPANKSQGKCAGSRSPSVEIVDKPFGGNATAIRIKPSTKLAENYNRSHEKSSAEKALRATAPSPDAVTAEVLKYLPPFEDVPPMKCMACMNSLLFGDSTVCEFRGIGYACATCYNKKGPRCSFELNPAQVDDMVQVFFKPWATQTITEMSSLAAQLQHANAQALYLRSCLASIELSATRTARALRRACETLYNSGSVEQVSYLFDPPSVFEALLNVDVQALNDLEAELIGSGILPDPSHISPAPISVPAAAPSPVRAATPACPPITVLPDSSPVRPRASSVHEEAPLPEEDELMPGIEEEVTEDAEDVPEASSSPGAAEETLLG
ncbi:hypothetical protein M413DRAFT_28895 [Hebeloma cylindrosporum]|uniref:Uncharacterized protein n=1 Tax=Hebeloma cylindrosporum TaxID=76867 RepID=A0A0C2YF78_HEBCY|nr:hypothetical protein M413DRAFT_28895 [Hebeloma cylindrosporum h7]